MYVHLLSNMLKLLSLEPEEIFEEYKSEIPATYNEDITRAII